MLIDRNTGTKRIRNKNLEREEKVLKKQTN